MMSSLVIFTDDPVSILMRRNLSLCGPWHLNYCHYPLSTWQVCKEEVGVMVPVLSWCRPLLTSLVPADLHPDRPSGGISVSSLS
jgi:hypothetical protein